MQGYTKDLIELYGKAMLPLIKKVGDTQNLNERLLILAEYGQVSGVLNELLAAVAFSDNQEEISEAIAMVEEAIISMSSNTPNIFSDDGTPQA